MRLTRYGVLAAAIVIAAAYSCIDRHIPAPDVRGEILAFEVEGQMHSTIDAVRRTVTLELSEEVDMRKVRVTKLTLTEGASCDLVAGGLMDLSQSQKITVTTVAGYEWTVSATQNIERRFEIDRQVGVSYFELHSHSAFAYVAVGTDMEKIKILSLKLWPEGVSYTLDPKIKDGDVVAFRSSSGTVTKVREVVVKYRDITETWYLYITETNIALDTVDPFARHVCLAAHGEEGPDNGFEYRLASASEWTRVPEGMMTGNSDGVFSATLTGLTPATDYVVRVFSGESEGEQKEFTTEAATQPRNAGFEDWSKPANPWLAYTDVAQKFWDTGNDGATLFNPDGSVTMPADDPRPGSRGSRSAKLASKTVMGIFAAGNIYSGNFAGVSGTGGKVRFGQPFASRPSALTVWYKASAGTVDKAKDGAGITTGDTDKYQIYIALADSGFPHEVDTNDKKTFLDYTAHPGIIAYGDLTGSANVAAWTQATIQLTYRSLDRTPTHIIIVASASMYGDYFTGSTSSVLCVDDFELIYNDNIVLQQ